MDLKYPPEFLNNQHPLPVVYVYLGSYESPSLLRILSQHMPHYILRDEMAMQDLKRGSVKNKYATFNHLTHLEKGARNSDIDKGSMERIASGL